MQTTRGGGAVACGQGQVEGKKRRIDSRHGSVRQVQVRFGHGVRPGFRIDAVRRRRGTRHHVRRGYDHGARRAVLPFPKLVQARPRQVRRLRTVAGQGQNDNRGLTAGSVRETPARFIGSAGWRHDEIERDRQRNRHLPRLFQP